MSVRIDSGTAVQGSDSSRVRPPAASPAAHRYIWSAVGIALGLGLLYAATRKVDGSRLIATLEGVRAVWVAGILGIVFSFVLIKAWRWKLLLRFVPDVTFRELHAAVYIGLAANFLLAHTGEFLRTAMVARRRQAAFSGVFASVLVERALDFIALLVLLSVFGLAAPDVHPVIKLGAILTGVVVAIAVTGLHLALGPPAWLARIAAIMLRPLPERGQTWLEEQLGRARQGLASVRDLRRMAIAIALSILQWLLIVFAIWWSALAVGQPMSLTAAAVTFALIVLGLTLPNAPMQVGVTQLAFTVGMGLDGTPATSAVAASIVYTAFLILPVMVIGAACLVRQGGWQPVRTA